MYSQSDYEQQQRQYQVQQQRLHQQRSLHQPQPPQPTSVHPSHANAGYAPRSHHQPASLSTYQSGSSHNGGTTVPAYDSAYGEHDSTAAAMYAPPSASDHQYTSDRRNHPVALHERHAFDPSGAHSGYVEQDTVSPSQRSARSGEQGRPVSTSPSTIIGMYASSSTDASYQSSSGALSSLTNEGYSSFSNGRTAAHPRLETGDGAWKHSYDTDLPPLRSPNGSGSRRPLPKIPSSPDAVDHQNSPAQSMLPSPLSTVQRSKSALPVVPDDDYASHYYKSSTPSESLERDFDLAMRLQEQQQQESGGYAPSTPSLGKHAGATSNDVQPQTPPAWSPPGTFRSQGPPSRRATPTIRETPPPGAADEPTGSAAKNRTKSIVGHTLISPGLVPSLPVPTEHMHRVRNPSAESFREVMGKTPEPEWGFSTPSDLLSPGFGMDSAQSPQLPDEEPDAALLSNVALLLRDAVPRGQQIKGSVAYPYSFTGKDVVSTLLALIPEEKLMWASHCVAMTEEGIRSPHDGRSMALCIAKSLKNQLFFHEVDWGLNELQDGVEDVYMFLEDSMGDHSTAADDFDVELSRAANGSKLHKGQMTRANDLVDLPTGVFTAMTVCYSPLCGRPNVSPHASCYSSSCPRSSRYVNGPSAALGSSVLDQTVKTTAVSKIGASHNAVAWVDTVPADVLATLSKDEIKRQNAILELIQKEEEFLHDLELLEKLFLARLVQSPATSDPQSSLSDPNEREEFAREVFSNHTELTGHIRMLVERLHIRQREEGFVVAHIGDVYLNAALEWGGAFESNMTSFPMAKHRLLREAARNPQFATFLEECRRDPACHRLPMDHFLQRATTRLPRYNLHFKSILKDTDESNTDCESLTRAIELVDEQCKFIQKGVAAAETKVKIREYAYNLATKRNKMAVHMDLLNPERQLVHQGRVYRKQNFTDFEWQDLLAVLFDNYLVVTKTKKREDGDRSISRFVLEKRPIAVEMMQLIGFSDPPISRSLGLSNFHIRSERENRDLFPFTISHIAGKIEPLTLYVSSKAARDEWKAKIEEAIGLRAAVQEANKLFEIWSMSSDFFALPPSQSVDPERAPAGVNATEFRGLVTCAVPFRIRDGRQLIAIGCADGVWIGLRNDAKSLRKVLHLKLVMQCAVLDAFGIFVVLADKVLISYSLDALVPSATSPSNPRPPQKLSGNRDVMFFAVGQVKERTLLVYMKKKPNESVFRALEPVAAVGGVKNEHGKGASVGGGFFNKFGKDSKSSDWFREFKTFFIPSEAYSMQFLRAKLCIVCARGFEIIDLDNLIPGTIPDFSLSSREDPRVYALSRRVETARPLGMFKNSDGDFLLCYDGFACFVDRRGSPIKLDQVIEWEGVPQAIAFKEPYILAFDQRFIEVRDSVSGELVQLIRAHDLRNITFSSSTASDEEQALILVQRLRSPQRKTHDFQQVFELIGTPMFQHHAVRRTMMQHRPSFVSGSERSTSQSGLWPTGGGSYYAGNDGGSSAASTFHNNGNGGSGATIRGLQRTGTTATTATNYTSNSNSSSLGGGSRKGPWF